MSEHPLGKQKAPSFNVRSGCTSAIVRYQNKNKQVCLTLKLRVLTQKKKSRNYSLDLISY